MYPIVRTVRIMNATANKVNTLLMYRPLGSQSFEPTMIYRTQKETPHTCDL